jgi:hypothetical protein
MTTNNPYQLSINLSQLSDTINPLTRSLGARYIITATEYLTRWEEEAPVKDCSADTTTHLIFEQVITRFICPMILMSDQGKHFINSTIYDMTEEFEVYTRRVHHIILRTMG